MALKFCFLIYIMDILIWTPLLLGIKKRSRFCWAPRFVWEWDVEEKEKNSKNA